MGTFNNQFRHGKRHFELVGLPQPRVAGARFEKLTLDEEIGPEIGLILNEPTSFADELQRRRPFELHLKSGSAETSVGPVLFLLWWMPPVKDGKPLALYEQILNPAHRGTLEGLTLVSRQTHIHVILVGPRAELLDVFEFENVFGLGRLASVSQMACDRHAGMDFALAKHEYDQNYDLMELFSASEG